MSASGRMRKFCILLRQFLRRPVGSDGGIVIHEFTVLNFKQLTGPSYCHGELRVYRDTCLARTMNRLGAGPT